MGINFLLPLRANIDVDNQHLRIFGKYIIQFENDIPIEIAEANQLESIEDIYEEILRKNKRR